MSTQSTSNFKNPAEATRRKRALGVPAAAIATILSLAACSPYEYSKEVSDFGTGIDHFSAAVGDEYTGLTAEQLAALELTMLETRPPAALAHSCTELVAKPLSPPCALTPFRQPEPVLLQQVQTRAAVMPKVEVLSQYVHGLQAVTNAADRTAFDGAAKRLSASVGNLAELASPGNPAIGAAAPAAVNLVLWVVGEALDQDRFDALKGAVEAADGHVRTIVLGPNGGDGLNNVLKQLHTTRQRILITEISQARQSLGPALAPAAYKERYTRAAALVAKLNALREVDPMATATALVEAHAKLVQAVKDPARQYGALMTATSRFAANAKALRDSLAPPAKSTAAN